MSQEPQEFLADNETVKLTGWKLAEVRGNGVAMIVIACDYRSCSALHLHLLAEEEGQLYVVTTLDSQDDEAIARSAILFRAVSLLATGSTSLSNVLPAEDAPKKVMEIIPGLTPWGKA